MKETLSSIPAMEKKLLPKKLFLIFFSTEIHPGFIEQDKGIPFVWLSDV